MVQSAKSRAFFRQSNDGQYIGNDAARGPWDEHACHAGPVTGVIARELEQLVTDKQLFRLTVELLRPVPMSGFYLETGWRKQGRMVSTAEARLLDPAGRLIATAASLHAQVLDVGALPTAVVEHPRIEEAQPGDFPVREAKHDLPFFSSGIEIAYPPDQDSKPGPTTLWMRTIDLVEGEEPSPFQRLCPIADCGNGISRNLEVGEASFLNPDLTVVMYRAPGSRWLASRARSFWEPHGHGMAEATLFDTRGPIGAALQTLLVSPVAATHG